MVNRVIQKILKIDTQYYLKKGGWVAGAQILASLCVIILALVLGNILEPQVFGKYKYLISIAATLSIFTLPGLNVALIQSSSKGSTYIRTALSYRKYGGLLGAVVCVGISIYYFLNGENVLGSALIITGAALPFYRNYSLFESFLNGQKRFREYSLRTSLRSIFHTFVVIVVALFFPHPLWLLVAYLTSYVLIRFVIYGRIVRPFKETEEDRKGFVKHGIHQTLISIVGVGASQADKILMFHFFGATQLAIYAFAIAVPEQIKILLKSTTRLTLPRFASKTEKEMEFLTKNLLKKVFIFFVILLGISILYILTAPYIYKFLFPQYIESVLYSQVLSLSLVAVIGQIPLSMLTAQKKLKEQYSFYFVQPTIQLGLFVYLIPFYGLMGAVVASILGRIFSTAYVFWLLFRVYKK